MCSTPASQKSLMKALENTWEATSKNLMLAFSESKNTTEEEEQEDIALFMTTKNPWKNTNLIIEPRE